MTQWRSRRRNRASRGLAEDEGTITLLTLGFMALGLLLIVVVVDVSAVFVARKGLLADCDAVALKAAQSLDIDRLYGEGADKNLPLDPDVVNEEIMAIGQSVGANPFSGFWGDTDGRTIHIHAQRWVRMPFLPQLQAHVISPVYVKAECTTVSSRRDS